MGLLRGRRLTMRAGNFTIRARRIAVAACPKARLNRLLNEGTYPQRDFAARLAACGKPPDEVATSLKAIFANADIQGTGALTLAGVVDAIGAVKKACPLARHALDPVTAVRHFERADQNQDGVLSFEEFHTYVAQHVLLRAYELKQCEATEARKQLSDNGIIERRVSELVPGIEEAGVHENRLLLFGGEPPGADAVLMRSNDYLSLSGHPAIAAARAEAMVNEGQGEARPRVFTMADIDRHRALELRLASLLHSDDAAVTMSGAHAVLGLLKTLRGPNSSAAGTPIYSDRLSWTTASLRYDLATTPFAHNNMDALSALAHDEPGIIVIDSLYGNGAVANIEAAAEIAEATGSVLVVDETHAFGCADGGLGIVDELGLAHRVHFRTLGFSKALAARGGAIVGPSRALEAFRFNDSTMIFSTAPKAHEAVGWDATLDVVLEEGWRRDRLHRNFRLLHDGMHELGLGEHVAHSSRQILTVVTGDAATTQAFRNACAIRGVYGAVFCPPFAQQGKTFVRFSVHTALAEADIRRFLECMQHVKHLLPSTAAGAFRG